MAADKFDWEELSIKAKQQASNRIQRNPYSCDGCGDIYYKPDLFRHGRLRKCTKCSEKKLKEK